MDINVKKLKLKAIFFYNVFFTLAAIGFYFLIPIILNYPPNCINNAFERTIDIGVNYYIQYIFIIVFTLALCDVYFISQINTVEKYKEYMDKDDETSKKKLEKIKRQCFAKPYQIYAVHAIMPNIVIYLILLLSGTDSSLTNSVVALTFSFTVALGLVAYRFSENLFSAFLSDLKNRKKYMGRIKISFRRRIILLFVPLFLLVFLFNIITANTMVSKERGNFLHENYLNQIELYDNVKILSIEDAVSILSNIKKYNEDDTYFIITKQDVIYLDTEREVTDFFRKYTFDVADEGHTYSYFVPTVQGTFIKFELNGENYAMGVMYDVDSSSVYSVLSYTMIAMILLSTFFLLYVSRGISEQIGNLSENMSRIANEQIVDYTQKMSVISNDEFGDLVIAFNKILDLQKAHADEIERNQEMLVERERLSSLGQLIGGMAHNLKTPIMSIAGASQAIRELIEEYNNSVGNLQVTNEDHHEIAKEMKEWNEKIKLYLEYMTEVINATKGQAVSMNASTVNDFTIEELVARVKILMKEQLMQRGCNLNLNIAVSKDTVVKGEISAIVQVIDNLIVNAMDAYNGSKGDIVLRMKDDDKKLYIEIQDFAGGIPENVQKKLFKQMITTKGKAGTGLGLYMCYSTIKGKFNGDMRFETEPGKGTTFFIELNKN